MCNLHWCYTFCTGITLFALVLHLNCTALGQSESSNFFMYIINFVTITTVISSRVEIYMLFAGREIRIGKNCARGLE